MTLTSENFNERYRVIEQAEGSAYHIGHFATNNFVEAVHEMGLREGFDQVNPKPVATSYWIAELVDNEWKKVDLDFI